MELNLRPEVADKYNLSATQKADEIGISGVGTVVLSQITLERVNHLKSGDTDLLPMLIAKENAEVVLEKKKSNRLSSPDAEAAN